MIRAIAIAGALAAALGCRGKSEDTDEAPDPIEEIARPAALDDRVEDKPGFIAVLTPKYLADVPAPYTSASAALAVKLGDQVTKGQVLARLDDRQLRQELDNARAAARTAQASVRAAEVDLRGYQVVLQREKSAEAAGVGAKADLVSAKQSVDKSRAALDTARATTGERTTRIKELEAHLAEMTLASPIAGSVALIYPQDGARVEEGHPIIRVISGGVFVKFAIPADKVGSVKPGDLVDLRIERRSGGVLGARVGHIAPELDAVAQMIIADAELVNAPADLQPGTVCRILPRTAAASR